MEKKLWQPTLVGLTLIATPLQENDFGPLFDAASDPEIWLMHPAPDRYLLPQFEKYFRGGVESQGALLVREKNTGIVVGSSRFYDYNSKRKSIIIGYTFLIRRLWTTGANQELKELMINYAFQYIEQVEFEVGSHNLRSRRAVEKRGAKLHSEEKSPTDGKSHVIYTLSKATWEHLHS